MISSVRSVFSTGADGDLRGDPAARAAFGDRHGVPATWATVRQVHGSRVVVADRPGDLGEADALVTATPDLTLVVFTADCLGVVIDAGDAVGVVHAGWRGLAAGVIERTIEVLEAMGASPLGARFGPSIGPCCYEVGVDVSSRFPRNRAMTTWGTTSVDLRSAAAVRLGIPVVIDDRCTRCGGGMFSHRADGTASRMATVGWVGP